MRTAPLVITGSALGLGLLLTACGSGGSRHLASAASTSSSSSSQPTPAPETTASLPPGTLPPAAAVAAGPPTTKAAASVTTASTAARTTLPPTTAPRSTTTAAPRPTTTAGGYTFHERDYTFAPASFRVAAGTAVTIVNDGPSTHTWTADAGAWDSGSLAPGRSYTYTFSAPGTFSFKCTIHPVMQGSVTVT